MVHRAEYMREYYKQNKKRILGRLRNRYEKDPEWVEEQKKKRREDRKRRRALKKHQENEYKKLHGNKPRGVRMKIIHPEDDSRYCVCMMYTLPETAKIIGIPKTQIKSWVHLDRIPFPQYRSKKNYRLYTEYEVGLLKIIVKQERRRLKKEYLLMRIRPEITEKINYAFGTLIGGVPESEFKEDDND